MTRISQTIYLLGILLCVCTNSVRAETLNISDFKAVVTKIKGLNRFSYDAATTVVFPNGKTEALKTTTYMDTKKMNYAYKTNFENVILNNKWFYRANHSRKFVSVFDIKKYATKYPGTTGDLTSIFKSTLATDFLDSLVAWGGKLKTGNRNGNIASFEFEFRKEATLKSLILKFNESNGLPESIYMHTVSLDLNGRPTSYKIVCDKYNTSFSDAEFSTDAFFSTSGSKVSLLKYKNYKVSSIL